MPIMNGIDATRRIRSFLSEEVGLPRENQPYIFGVTGHVLDSFKEEGKSAGMDEILGKPLYVNILAKIFK
jgi:CheY-like chemotaxis protein